MSEQSARAFGRDPFPALLPRDDSGFQFVFYGDCCSGIPGTQAEANFAAVNAVVQRLSPAPEFICFIGDHIGGLDDDPEAVRRQWCYWLDHEMAWLDPAIPIYHTTSNHNTPNAQAEVIWRETFPGLPQNGPPGQEGLSYYVRRGNLLLVCTNSAWSGLGGSGHVECDWLDRVLAEHADAVYKLVAGHYPIFPVNGYTDYPLWRVVPSQARPFRDVLLRHGVLAYLCSHIIAFDVQAHDGLLQILTGGAGTNYGPGGFMPGQTEYLHAIQCAVDRAGLRYQVLDTDGCARESLSWPFETPARHSWKAIPFGTGNLRDPNPWWEPDQPVATILLWRFRGARAPDAVFGDQTLFCAWCADEGPATLSIGLAAKSNILTVQLVPEAGGGAQTWTGPALAPGQPFDFQLALHTGMGPGGVLWRKDERTPWSSLLSSSARGAERMAKPQHWTLGHAQSGVGDHPFRGTDLSVTWCRAS
jgi:hypothetical protein